MSQTFESFVIFAGMRTGSNLLEAMLNKLEKVSCYGEAFNTYMMGWPGNEEIHGITRAHREENPQALLQVLNGRDGKLNGFRYFHDHDPRAFDLVMNDRSCAKIILTRNPLDSFVSTALAYETEQWKINQSEVPKSAQIEYDGAAFRELLDNTSAFQRRIRNGLQSTAQTAFQLDYLDLQDDAVVLGLLHWLGLKDIEHAPRVQDQVPQNPREMKDKVSNFQQMRVDLKTLDMFETGRLPIFEAERAPTVRSFQTSEAGKGLIYMPIYSGALIPHFGWLQDLADTKADFNRNDLRHWKRQHPGHRSFSILRHPVHRAWLAFEHLLANAEPQLRQLLRDVLRVNLPPDDELAQMDEAQTTLRFLEFVDFLGRNLKGQTSIPTQPHWATQTAVLSGYAQFTAPDFLLRESRLQEDIANLCHIAGIGDPKVEALDRETYPEFLSDPRVTRAVKSAYARDYVDFGFEDQPR